MRTDTSSRPIADAPALAWPFPAWLPRAIGAAVAAMGLAVLAGWALDAEPLKAVLPGHVTMKANTALGFFLAGAGLWLAATEGAGRRPVATAMGLAAALIGLVTAAQYALGVDLGVDEALVHDDPGAVGTSDPGRMALASALAFVLTGAALMLLPSRGGRAVLVAQALAIIAGVIALIAFLGYLYDSPRLTGPTSYTRMAVHTSLGFMALCWGILALRPDRGLMRWLNTDTPGGASLRWLLPAAVAVPALGGWLRLQGERAGLYDTEFGIAVFALWNIAAFAALSLINTALLDRTDAARREAAHALRESEATMRALAEGAGEAILTVDANGIITFANPAAETMFGHARRDLLGMPISALIPERLRAGHDGYIAAFMADPAARRMGNGFELLAVRGDGSEFDVEVSLSPLETPAGSAVMALVLDVTERHRLEAQRRLASAAMGATVSAIVITGADGVITWVNPAFVRMTGYTFDEAVGQNPRMLKSGQQDEAFYEGLWATILAGGVWSGEIVNRRKDGTLYTEEQTITPVRDGHGRVTHFVAIKQDVSERKAAEKALRESEQKLRAMVTAAPVIIWTVDRDLTVTFSEGQALAGIGLEPGQVTGRRIAELYPDRTDITEAHRRALAGESLTSEISIGGRSFQAQFAPIRAGSGTITGALGVATDLTERKRAEKALRESESLLRNVVEGTSDAVFVKDNEGRYLLANGATAAVVGMPAEQVVGSNDTAIFPPEVANAVQATDQRIIAGGVAEAVEEDVTFLDGTRRFYLTTKAPLRNDAGEITGLLGIARDITERKRMEEELRLSRQQLKDILDNTLAVVSVKDIGGRYIMANRRYGLLLGRPAEEIAGHTDFDLWPPETARAFRASDERVMQTGDPAEFEEAVVLADGTHHYISLKFPMRDAGGALYGVCTVATDVTDRKRAEEALLASQQKLWLMFDTMADVMFLLKVEPDGCYRFESVNGPFLASSGLSLDQVLGRCVDEVLPPASRSFVLPKYREALQTGATVRWEETSDYPSGRRTGEVAVTPVMDSHGRCTHLLGSVHDITERRQAEAERQKLAHEREQLAHRLLTAQEEERRRVAYDIHDGPAQLLAAADMHLEAYVAARDDPEAGPGAEQNLQVAKEHLGHALQDARRIISDLRPSVLDDFGLPDALRQYADVTSARSGVRIEYETNMNGVRIDPMRETALYRIAQESVTNALKHSGAERVRVSLRRRNGDIVLVVADGGAGFERGAAGGSPSAPGHNVGLASMRERARLIGARFRIESSRGRGTTVRVVLPVAPRPPEGGQSDAR